MNRFIKNHCLALLALTLLLAMAAPTFANEAHGNIAWIEPDDYTFTLVDDNNNVLPMRLLVTGRVLINDQEATFWDIRPGDQVTVTYDRDSDGMTATLIECRHAN